ncbi:class A beta-lactamase-related serine hydrolase [Duganella callida]|uniref:Class A beta-lactamase-related serine hydrolase n=2 Tax=Duganella callida TaxID=2561932 RepID=A0A4Y9RZJ4_9BURK|nr:class A beta-lactamase-related serine hydrolase [Duganella callida]
MRLTFSIMTGLMLAAAARAQALDQVLARWDQDTHPDLRSVLVQRDGAIVAERYYNGEIADTLHDIRSAGKSVTALLAGAARLNPDARIDHYWPQAKGTALDGITLDQVLSMRSGLAAFDEDPASPGNEDKMDDAADPIAFTLATPRETTPGTRYRYNSLTAYIAGVTVEKATGKDLEDYARGALFQPLGIQRWAWGRDVAGHPKGQGNLSLRTRDLARIGQLVLNQGVYDGKRIVDADWLAAALAPRVAIGDNDRYADHYGYFWYRKTQQIDGRPVLVHFASGNGGNKIYVIPSRQMVVVVTSSAYGKGYGQLRSENILKAVLAAAP